MVVVAGVCEEEGDESPIVMVVVLVDDDNDDDTGVEVGVSRRQEPPSTVLPVWVTSAVTSGGRSVLAVIVLGPRTKDSVVLSYKLDRSGRTGLFGQSSYTILALRARWTKVSLSIGSS